MRVPGVLAEKHRHIAVLEVRACRAPHHAITDPELAGLLLRERTRSIANAQRAPRRSRIGRRQVIPLPAPTVIEDGLAAVRVTNRAEPRGDFANGRVPVDRLERAVGSPAQGRGDAITAVLI